MVKVRLLSAEKRVSNMGSQLRNSTGPQKLDRDFVLEKLKALFLEEEQPTEDAFIESLFEGAGEVQNPGFIKMQMRFVYQNVTILKEDKEDTPENFFRRVTAQLKVLDSVFDRIGKNRDKQ